MIDETTQRYTFEKCVFEAYMAFRGIGGKKPDEGRGNWAQSFLKEKNDPKRVGDLTSPFHNGNRQSTFFWINQILEFYGTERQQKEFIAKYVVDEEKQIALENLEKLDQLAKERNKFEQLCQDFDSFLATTHVVILPYPEVFNRKKENRTTTHPSLLDRFIRDTVLPSEDFEIIYAAISIRADIFVTDDKKLTVCAHSLGLNYPLSAYNFCESWDYEQKVQEIRFC